MFHDFISIIGELLYIYIYILYIYISISIQESNTSGLTMLVLDIPSGYILLQPDANKIVRSNVIPQLRQDTDTEFLKIKISKFICKVEGDQLIIICRVNIFLNSVIPGCRQTPSPSKLETRSLSRAEFGKYEPL